MAKVTIEADGWEAATKSDLMKVQRKVWWRIGKRHHKKYKRNKFTTRGAKKYKFAPRSGDPGSGRRYQGSYRQAKVEKRRMFSRDRGDRFDSNEPLPTGEVKPNVWAGRSRRSMLAGNKVKAVARSSGMGRVDVIFDAPLLHMNNRRGKVRPHLEVTRVTPDELKDHSEYGARSWEKELLRVRRRKTIR